MSAVRLPVRDAIKEETVFQKLDKALHPQSVCNKLPIWVLHLQHREDEDGNILESLMLFGSFPGVQCMNMLSY